LRAAYTAAKMASVVTLIIEKKHEKNIQIISDLPTLIFSQYETRTTGIFLGPMVSTKLQFNRSFTVISILHFCLSDYAPPPPPSAM
jgi:hypothetical protein